MACNNEKNQRTFPIGMGNKNLRFPKWSPCCNVTWLSNQPWNWNLPGAEDEVKNIGRILNSGGGSEPPFSGP